MPSFCLGGVLARLKLWHTEGEMTRNNLGGTLEVLEALGRANVIEREKRQ